MNIIRARIKGLHSPDIPDLSTYKPSEVDVFGFLLQVMIGPAESVGEESFDVTVCTPRWLERHMVYGLAYSGRHHLIIGRYDYRVIYSYLENYANSCVGRSWRDVALSLARIGKWEFEDYTN